MGDHSSAVGSNPRAPRPPVSLSDNPAIDFGALLRRARRQRGLTLQQVAATTRIPIRYLEALERNDFSIAPAVMYLRAEVRAYADAVGLSPDIALEWLHDATEPAPVVARPERPTPASTVQRASHLRVAVVGFAVALIAIAVWASRRDTPSTAPPPTASQTSTTFVDQEPVPTATSGAASSDPAGASVERVTANDISAAQPTIDAELDVVTAPAGAHVTIDGVGWGTTPLNIRYLEPGRKRLRVTRDGFVAEERVIEFSADRPRTTVRLTLRPRE